MTKDKGLIDNFKKWLTGDYESKEVVMDACTRFLNILEEDYGPRSKSKIDDRKEEVFEKLKKQIGLIKTAFIMAGEEWTEIRDLISVNVGLVSQYLSDGLFESPINQILLNDFLNIIKNVKKSGDSEMAIKEIKKWEVKVNNARAG
jgi:hypothetical protein